MSINVDAVSGNFVAVVSGIDLTTTLTDSDVSDIVNANDQYVVLIFQDQPFTQEQQVAFPSHLGPIDYGPQKALATIQTRLNEQALTDISNADASGKVATRTHAQSVMNIGNMMWHSDASYQHYPFRYSVLTCQVPAQWGSQTQFADLRGAHDTLDPHLIVAIEDKTGEFSSVHCRDMLGAGSSDAVRAMFPPVRWPLVRTHAATGRKILWVGKPLREIDGMPTHEAHMLANILLEHATDRKRVHTHERSAGDLVVWENCSVLHRGRWFDLDARRQMRRAGTSDDMGSVGALANKKPGYSRMAGMIGALFHGKAIVRPWLYMMALLVATRAMPALAASPVAVNDATDIRHILDKACADMVKGKIEGTTEYFQPDIIVYDLVPPLISDAENVRQGNIRLQSTIDGQFSCKYEAIETRMLGPSYAFTASIIYAHGKLKNGSAFAMRMRSTDIWEKTTDGWRAIHEHTSLPFDPATGKALFTLPLAKPTR